MSGRRAGNRIRGPQSALTDFLAANNISAAQIRDDYQRRRQQTEGDDNGGEGPSTAVPEQTEEEAQEAANEAEAEAEEEEVAEKSKKRKRAEKDSIDSIKKAKKAKKDGKNKKKKRMDPDDDFEDDDLIGYEKSKPAPGQFEHCEICSKRFTVTPYSKEGPEGGLVCTPCGKELGKDLKAEKKAAAKPAGKKRRKLESDRLDGMAIGGAKSLQQLCIEKVAQHHEDVEGLGDMPAPIVERLSEIFSKRRVLKPQTLKLFLRPDLDSVVVHDAAYLEPDDYTRIVAEVPNMQRLVLGNACQLKDNGLGYMLEKCHHLKHVQVYAGNLVSNEMWHKFFQEAGPKLETLKLTWLDAAFEDETVRDLVEHSPNLRRLKLKLCRRIGEESVTAITSMPALEHLTLQIGQEVSNEALCALVKTRGPGLRTLALETFRDLDDTVLAAIHDSCHSLSKFRISENDTATDAAFASLFTEWDNPPLKYIDVNSTRDIDNNNPTGPEEAIGVASAGFKAMMAHSGSALKHLDISSCRHIELTAFEEVFNGSHAYPMLEHVNVSFCNTIDTTAIAGIFKSCPNLKRLIAFGCFKVEDVVVPKNVALIGVPRAQDAIEQFGVGFGIEEAAERLPAVTAGA
ncbi:hypothetical protein MBLNU230_g6398t1 [Neophaeotheca triangularis]